MTAALAFVIGFAAFVVVSRAGLYLSRLARDLDEENERLRKALAAAPKLWDCPDCAFSFDAVHHEPSREDQCPVCAESRLKVESAWRTAWCDYALNALCGAAFVQGQLLGGVLRAGVEGLRHAQCPYDDCTCQRGPNFWQCRDLVDQLEATPTRPVTVKLATLSGALVDARACRHTPQDMFWDPAWGNDLRCTECMEVTP